MKNLLNFKTRAIICISICLISIVSTVSARDTIAIIDAGSSGSRLYVYQVDKNETINTLFTTKGPALSTITPCEDSIKVFLESITNKYKENKENKEGKEGKEGKIPLYVLATAGMRMIPKTKADSIYTKMNKLKSSELENNGFRLDTAMTISGQYEGLYAWIAANYKAKKLTIGEKNLAVKEEEKENTLGILEIGGASMQVAFLTTSDCVSDAIPRDSIGRIYSKSYLHYGVDRIFEQFRILKFTDILLPLSTIKGLYNDSIRFVGLSNPIKHRKKELTHSDREKDSHENYHPAINNIYIGWVLDQLKLGDKLCESNITSDWTQGAALDILINGKYPQSFNYNDPN